MLLLLFKTRLHTLEPISLHLVIKNFLRKSVLYAQEFCLSLLKNKFKGRLVDTF